MTIHVMILADDRDAIELADRVRANGGWVVATASPEVASLTAIDDRPDVLIADLHRLDMAETEAVLLRLAILDTQLIVRIAVAQIDLAVALLDDRRPLLLADPDPIELAAAIAAALDTKTPAAVRETDRLPGLHELSEETGRIARALAEHAQTYHPSPPPAVTPGTAPRPIPAGAVRRLIRERRLRDRYFDAEIFADPAWDMLLDLYAARLEGGRVAVSSLCIAAHVPPTTALRWIRALTEQGLLVRVADAADRRRMFVALSEDAADRMARYFAAAEG